MEHEACKVAVASRYLPEFILFMFVLGINVWWDRLVARWVGRSGIRDGYFHLNDGVLIALATTSAANFIGLVAIVAKHLFPEMKDKP